MRVRELLEDLYHRPRKGRALEERRVVEVGEEFYPRDLLAAITDCRRRQGRPRSLSRRYSRLLVGRSRGMNGIGIACCPSFCIVSHSYGVIRRFRFTFT